MYNEKQKQAFINSEGRGQIPQKVAAMNWCESAELIFEKDVSTFNTVEADILLNHDKKIRFPVLQRYKNIIGYYVEWCINNKLCENVELLDYLVTMIPTPNNVKNYTVGDPETALEYITRISPDFNSYFWNDCRIRMLFIAAYTGLTGEELMESKRKDIDLEKKIWYNNGTALPIWDVFIPSIKKFLECRSFIIPFSNGRTDLVQLDNYDTLVIPERVNKSGDVIQNKLSTLASILLTSRKKYFDTYGEDFPYSVKDMILSGRFYRGYKGLEEIYPGLSTEYQQWQKEFY